MIQKLVSIPMRYGHDGGFLENMIPIDKRDPPVTYAGVRHHLTEFINDGWEIVQLVPLNGSGGGKSQDVSGWLFVLLQK